MPRAKAAPIPTPQEGAVRSSLAYDVRIYPVKTEGALRANATVNLNNEFALTNIRVMEGSKGLFVSMPQYKGRNGEYKDICFPCTKESRTAFNDAVLSAYEQTMAQRQAEAPKQEASAGQQQEQASQPQMASM